MKGSNTKDSKKRYPADSMPRQYVAKNTPLLNQSAYTEMMMVMVVVVMVMMVVMMARGTPVVAPRQ